VVLEGAADPVVLEAPEGVDEDAAVVVEAFENASSCNVTATVFGSVVGLPLFAPLANVICTDVSANRRPLIVRSPRVETTTWRWTRYMKSSTLKKRPTTLTS
jgi:hypothetical protein